MTKRAVALLGAPEAIGLVPDENGQPRRIDLAPGVLRDVGIAARLEADDLGDVEPPPGYADLERPAGRARNEEDLIAYSRDLAERIAERRRAEQFVVLLGGDCSIVLGALLGLRSVDPSPPGLVYIDAHADFATLDESPSGTGCSMALALAVGRDEQALAHLMGDEPLVGCEGVVHLARRDHTSPPYGAEALESYGVLDLPMSVVGSRDVLPAALERVAAAPGGFWVHFDVDALDPTVMPATGDPAPGGLDLAQAAELLAPIVRHPNALGLQLTLYDPTLDAAGQSAHDLVALLEHAVG